MDKILYQAIFLNEKSIEKLLEMQNEKLPKIPKNMHCTFKYNPSLEEIELFSKTLLGKKVKLKIVGYSSNGKNSGFKVELNKELEKIYTNTHEIEKNNVKFLESTIPHITVSMSNEAEAVNTGFLKFEKIKEPFYVSGIGGFLIQDENNMKKIYYNIDI